MFLERLIDCIPEEKEIFQGVVRRQLYGVSCLFPPSLGLQESNKSRQAALPTEPSCSLSHIAGPYGMYIPKERDIK